MATYQEIVDDSDTSLEIPEPHELLDARHKVSAAQLVVDDLKEALKAAKSRLARLKAEQADLELAAKLRKTALPEQLLFTNTESKATLHTGSDSIKDNVADPPQVGYPPDGYVVLGGSTPPSSYCKDYLGDDFHQVLLLFETQCGQARHDAGAGDDAAVSLGTMPEPDPEPTPATVLPAATASSQAPCADCGGVSESTMRFVVGESGQNASATSCWPCFRNVMLVLQSHRSRQQSDATPCEFIHGRRLSSCALSTRMSTNSQRTRRHALDAHRRHSSESISTYGVFSLDQKAVQVFQRFLGTTKFAHGNGKTAQLLVRIFKELAARHSAFMRIHRTNKGAQTEWDARTLEEMSKEERDP
ncbi:uncharacterized protein L969DRAFT_97365 [Mixia osmundae IAM 14324]|uniref:uncharacterized protein n=1 Tax=Mixia osmundae (strain CBS 9802 / IAM 14324 / JCM 22182 / KY 12970) TaxID=764103 RepID=UPI0004A54FD0|nr:uncharacterized protein L969DRAFT_97365 [Mixia osmundae IAM 14324]KEI36354.1 hypothetical protein L969DRAFT_97365 [Mixia osmundae IAM 14324]